MQTPSQTDFDARYDAVSRALHWAMAGLMGWQFLGMALREALGRTPLVAVFVGSHALVGTALLVLAAVRLLWAIRTRARRPKSASRSARAGHLALYALMILVPALALIRAYASTRGLSLLGVELTAPRSAEIAPLMVLGGMHGALGWLFGLLIAGHIGMVIWHETVKRDGTLARMMRRAK